MGSTRPPLRPRLWPQHRLREEHLAMAVPPAVVVPLIPVSLLLRLLRKQKRLSLLVLDTIVNYSDIVTVLFN